MLLQLPRSIPSNYRSPCSWGKSAPNRGPSLNRACESGPLDWSVNRVLDGSPPPFFFLFVCFCSYLLCHWRRVPSGCLSIFFRQVLLGRNRCPPGTSESLNQPKARPSTVHGGCLCPVFLLTGRHCLINDPYCDVRLTDPHFCSQ